MRLLTETVAPRVARLRSALRGGGFFANVVTLAGGTALGQLAVIASSPFLTRLYGPRDFGALALFTTAVGVLSVGASWRYESAIVAAADEREAAQLTLLSLVAATLTAVAAGLLFWLPGLRQAEATRMLQPWGTLLIGPAIWLTAVVSALRYWFVRSGDFKLVTTVTVIQNAGRAALQVALGPLGLGWLGLLLGDLAGRGMGLRRLATMSLPQILKQAGGLAFPELRLVAARYYRYPVYSLPSALIDTLAFQLPLPLLGYLYGMETAGHFSLVQRVLAIPIGLVGNSVADAFHSQLGSYARSEPTAVRGLFLRTARSLALGLTVPVLAGCALGPYVFGFVFGPEWVAAGALAAVMAPWALTQLVVSPLSRLVYVLGGLESKLCYDCVALFVTVAALLGGKKLNLSATQAVNVLSLLQTAAYGVYFAVMLRIITIFEKRSA